MLELLSQLIAITEVDGEIHAAREALARYPKALEALAAKEKAAADAASKAEAAKAAATAARRKAEQEVRALREKIQKSQEHQALVKTNKEFEAITAEIEGVREKIDAADTAGLEALEAEEAADKAVAKTAADLAHLKNEGAIERERLGGLSAEKQAILKTLEAERARLFDRLPEAAKEEYALLNERFPGTGVVPVRGGCCGGCNFTLVAQRILETKRASELVRCDHCRRIMYDAAAAGA